MEAKQKKSMKKLLAFFLILLIGIFLLGLLIPETSLEPNFSMKNTPPSVAYPFGTDWVGRNILLRTLKGLSTSTFIGVSASVVSALVATLIGVSAALGPPFLDKILGGCIDLMMSIPHIVLLILVSLAFGRGGLGLFLAVATTHWMGLARLIRGEVLGIVGQSYVMVSRRLGHSSWWIFYHHILPHMIPQILIGLVLLFPHVVLHESALSFLGYGLPPEQPAIGLILSESLSYLSAGMWWGAFFPGLLLVAMVLLFYGIGEQLQKIITAPYLQERGGIE